MKKLINYILLSIAFYIIYTIIINITSPAVLGIITLEENTHYYVPRQIRFFDNKKVKIAEIILDDYGNEVKATGKIPDGKIAVYYELASSRKKFMDSTVKENNLEGQAKVYYPNGKIWIEASYKSGKLDGQAKEYYTPVKSLKRSSYFVDGSREGKDKKYYTSGHLYNDSNYQKNKLQGLYQLFYEKGTLLEESTYDNGLKTGSSKKYYPSGKLYSVTNYQSGKLAGDYTTYYENGEVKDQGKISEVPQSKAVNFYGDIIGSYQENEFSGIYKLEEKNIQINSAENSFTPQVQNKKVQNNKNTKDFAANSSEQDYFQDVEIHTETNTSFSKDYQEYKKVQNKAEDRIIRETSSTRQALDFTSGKKLNAAEEAKEDRQAAAVMNDRIIRSNTNGFSEPEEPRPQGSTKIKKFYPGGAVYAELPYVNGLVDGQAKFYYETGRLKATISFKNNRKEGPAKTYFPNGLLESETIFMDDAPVSKKIFSEQGLLIYSW